ALRRKGQFDAEAIAEYREAIRLKPDLGEAHANLAQILATSADLRLRDLKQAILLAKKAIELKPRRENEAACWYILGVALYRNGDYQAAIEALSRSTNLPDRGKSFNYLFLAMTHRQLGEQEQARKWYDLGVEWMEKHPPEKDDSEDLDGIRKEAEALLGLPQGKVPPNDGAR